MYGFLPITTWSIWVMYYQCTLTTPLPPQTAVLQLTQICFQCLDLEKITCQTMPRKNTGGIYDCYIDFN